MHFRLHANYFLLPWKIPGEVSKKTKQNKTKKQTNPKQTNKAKTQNKTLLFL